MDDEPMQADEGLQITNAETITLSLEEAAKLIFQQQGIGTDGEGRLQPGTYQIITQPMTSMVDDQMQVSLGDGISIIQTADGLQGFELANHGVVVQQEGNQYSMRPMLQLADGTQLLSTSGDISQLEQAQTSLTEAERSQVVTQGGNIGDEELDGQSESVLQIDLPTNQSEKMLQIDLPNNQSEKMLQIDLPNNQSEKMLQIDLPNNQSEKMLQIDLSNNQSEKMLQMINQPLSANQIALNPDELDNGTTDTAEDTQYTVSLLQSASIDKEDANELTTDDRIPEESTAESVEDSSKPESQVTSTNVSSSASSSGSTLTTTSTVKVEKKPDLSKPIEVTDRMEVVINGKRCQLQVNPDTGQVCAYPLVTQSSGKKRGRPKKTEVVAEEPRNDSPVKTPGLVDQTSSAAEGLLELSNTGPDGVRRSGRSRRKAKTLDDYDMLDVSSDDDAAADNAEDEVLPTGAIRKRKPVQPGDFLSSYPQANPVRRGRGRPRRYPRPDTVQVTNQIPAMIIPSNDGQTIMMAPIQGLSNLEAFQEQVKNLSVLQQPQHQPGNKEELTDETLHFLNTNSILQLPDGSQVALSHNLDENLSSSLSASVQSDGQSDTAVAAQTEEGTDGGEMIGETQETLTEPSTGTSVSEPMLVAADLVNPVTDSLSEGSSLITSTALDGDDGLKLSTGEPSQPTIIQIPENLLPMFMVKKDPVKIGLKAEDGHLSKLKCPKCGFQAYYSQQYQTHIATHTDDVEKCKCCNFTAFNKEEVIKHFKVTHPRCICTVCDYMAEHAYVIKRHMMRHTQDGCKCELCGKVYKDQYVLKMHIKMVHLPAEVLFECTVCTKKFTRKAHLKRHLRIHDPEKPFKCPHCSYRGCERSDISKHLLIHEEPRHVCEVCGKAFRHIKNKELHLKRHSGQRDYKCGVCDFYGYTFTDIRKHIERKHTDSKTFICDKCGSAFKSEPLLREHKSKQCDMFMIEQALSIATSNGGTTHATIQIPSNYSLDGQQIHVDGQNIAIDNQGHITVEPITDGISLTEAQLQAAVSQGQITEAEYQVAVSQGQITENVYQAAVNQGQITVSEFPNDEGNQANIGDTEYEAVVSQGQITDSGGLIQDIVGQVHYVGNSAEGVNLAEDDEEEEEEELGEMEEEMETDMGDDQLGVGMSGLVSEEVDDEDEKQCMVGVNDQMMGIVNIIR